jgi:hypothetical protein
MAGCGTAGCLGCGGCGGTACFGPAALVAIGVGAAATLGVKGAKKKVDEARAKQQETPPAPVHVYNVTTTPTDVDLPDAGQVSGDIYVPEHQRTQADGSVQNVRDHMRSRTPKS